MGSYRSTSKLKIVHFVPKKNRSKLFKQLLRSNAVTNEIRSRFKTDIYGHINILSW